MTVLFWMQLQRFIAQDKNTAFKKRKVEKSHNVDAPFDVTLEVNKEAGNITNDLKYILLWTNNFYPLNEYSKGQTGLFETNCPATECYITANRNFFGGVFTKFDAIIFSGQNLKWGDLPLDRSPQQKYILITLETPQNRPPCDFMFEGFFNWTATYRLDSDIPHPYLIIRDIEGHIVGPKREMDWKTDMAVLNDKNEVNNRTRNNTKAVAWFVSNCRSKSKRELYVAALRKALQKYGHEIDIFGRCGPFQCPRMLENICNLILHDYFFYLALENSFDEDYVTEKVLTALQNNVVPIVYGGANYSRFLPPGSYIDAREHSVEQMAATINTLIQSPRLYKQYFSWKKYYIFEKAVHTECDICKALSNKTRFQEQTIHKKICDYWNFENKWISNFAFTTTETAIVNDSSNE